MRRNANTLKMQKPSLWQYSFYEVLALIIALAVLFMLPELGKLLQ